MVLGLYFFPGKRFPVISPAGYTVVILNIFGALTDAWYIVLWSVIVLERAGEIAFPAFTVAHNSQLVLLRFCMRQIRIPVGEGQEVLRQRVRVLWVEGENALTDGAPLPFADNLTAAVETFAAGVDFGKAILWPKPLGIFTACQHISVSMLGLCTARETRE